MVVYFNVKLCDIWEGNMITRSKIQTENIRSLGFWDIREGIILRRLVLRTLECIIVECWELNPNLSLHVKITEHPTVIYVEGI